MRRAESRSRGLRRLLGGHAGADCPPAAPEVAGGTAGAAVVDRLTVTRFLDGPTAGRLAQLVRASGRGSLIDLSRIPGFDSAGLDVLLAAQSAAAPVSVRIEGLETATARLLALRQDGPVEPSLPTVRLTRLHRIAVVTLSGPPEPGELAACLLAASSAGAAGRPPAAVVLDLIGAPVLAGDAMAALDVSRARLDAQGTPLVVVNAAAALPVTGTAPR